LFAMDDVEGKTDCSGWVCEPSTGVMTGRYHAWPRNKG
jgi:hypothetical protein